jgi:hypothetical protein
MKNLLTAQNYQKGLLIGSRWMAGVAHSEESGITDPFSSFVIDRESGSCLGMHRYETLELALDALNQMESDWEFQSMSGCGSGNCSDTACGSSTGCGSGRSGEAGSCAVLDGDACPTGAV